MNKRINGQGCYSWTTLKISNPKGMGKKKDPKFRYQSKLEVHYQFEEN
jgi:hypothetical protein